MRWDVTADATAIKPALKEQKVSYEVLVVEPEVSRRAHLRQAMMATEVFSKITSASDTAGIFQAKKASLAFDIVYLSSRLPIEQVKNFLRKRREIAAATPCVAIAASEAQERWRIASGIMEGLDSFLFEPFSADAIRVSASLAFQARQQNEASRGDIALKLLSQSIVEQLHEVTALKAAGHSGKISVKMLHEMCSVLKDLDPAALETYYSSLYDACQRYGKPKPCFSHPLKAIQKPAPIRQSDQPRILSGLLGKAS